MDKRIIENTKYIVYSNGQIWSLYRDRFLKLSLDNKGYLIVNLQYKEGDKRFVKKKQVHQLVLRAFTGDPIEGKDWIIHLDNNLQNNNLSNLKWASPSDVKEKYWNRVGKGIKKYVHHSK